MAEPNRPVEEPSEDPGRRADADVDRTAEERPATAVPAGEREATDPVAEERPATAVPAADRAATTERIDEHERADARAATTDRIDERDDDRARPEATRPLETRPVEDRGSAEPARTTAVPPAPAQQQPVLAPAEETAPPAPKKHGNRLAATAWVLLATGLFVVVYFAAVALLELLIAGPQAVAPQLQVLATTGGGVLAWLPALFFFLLFELTVLLFNRAGRFAYVVASLIVGVLVYALSASLVPLVAGGSAPDRNTAVQAFLSPVFVLTGLVAREVMLWTGFAIGARGTRVRRRDKEARRRYEQELGDGRA